MTKETGFDVSVQPIDFATALEQAAAGKFDVIRQRLVRPHRPRRRPVRT